jgi:hypothetical protein
VGWGDLGRWDYDADLGTLAFSVPQHEPSVVADVQLVGSFSTNTGTFQWAWETLDAADPQARAASQLRVFGEVRGFRRLTTASWPATETDGWEMTALAAYLCGADGFYRAPFDHLYWFMLLANWRRLH